MLLGFGDRYYERLRFYRMALSIREDKTGPEDPDGRENAHELAESYGNMGALLMDLSAATMRQGPTSRARWKSLRTT